MMGIPGSDTDKLHTHILNMSKPIAILNKQKGFSFLNLFYIIQNILLISVLCTPVKSINPRQFGGKSMKSIQAEFDDVTQKISIKKDAENENWVRVCEKFNDDVSRIRDVTDLQDYTGLYECFDDHNKRFFYLVRENKKLYELKHRHFLDNLGFK
jgi:hypothetical protein